MKNTKGLAALPIIIVLVILIVGTYFFIIPLFSKKTGPVEPQPAQLRPCWWVYQTKGNYIDYEWFETFEVEGEYAISTKYGTPNKRYELNDDYIAEMYGCYKPSIVFSDISISGQEQEREDCIGDLKEFIESKIVEQCDDIDFAWGVEKDIAPIAAESNASPEEWNGKLHARKQTGGSCIVNLSASEQTTYENIEQTQITCLQNVGKESLNATIVEGRIIDRDPFTEFYLCEVAEVEDINLIIDNDELSVVCKKQI